MSILIADSGTTKTDWVLLDNNSHEIVAQSQTIGFNPYFQTSADISHELQLNLRPVLEPYLDSISSVTYYGTGCSNENNVNAVIKGVKDVFTDTEIEVNHDLLGAARALCGKQRGIACILGTGSNSCLYDGENIIENIVSVGYMFGDHGSGATIGKTFVQSYFDGKLPEHLRVAFEQAGYNREVILDNVYKKALPSRYLARVSTFLSQHISDPFVHQFIKDCFLVFFDAQVSKYTNARQYPVNSVGSIGYHYKAILEEAATERGFIMGNVIKSPIEGLIKFHR